MRLTTLCFVVASLWAAGWVPPGAFAADWPQWLGPNRDSIWREEGIIARIPEDGLKVKWRLPVGWGYAGPAVAGGRRHGSITDGRGSLNRRSRMLRSVALVVGLCGLTASSCSTAPPAPTRSRSESSPDASPGAGAGSPAVEDRALVRRVPIPVELARRDEQLRVVTILPTRTFVPVVQVEQHFSEIAVVFVEGCAKQFGGNGHISAIDEPGDDRLRCGEVWLDSNK